MVDALYSMVLHTYIICLQGSATYLGSSYFGYGEERVEFVSWEFPTRSSDVMVKLTVSSRNCIPITEAMYGTLRGGNHLWIVLVGFMSK